MNARLSAKPDKGSCSPHKKTPRPVIGRGVLAAGGEGGIRTLGTGVTVHSLSRRARSTTLAPLHESGAAGHCSETGRGYHSFCRSGRLILKKTRSPRSERVRNWHHLLQDKRL